MPVQGKKEEGRIRKRERKGKKEGREERNAHKLPDVISNKHKKETTLDEEQPQQSFFFFFASNDQEGAGTEPEPEIIMGPIHIFKQYLTYFL